jgi:hypothetical protein
VFPSACSRLVQWREQIYHGPRCDEGNQTGPISSTLSRLIFHLLAVIRMNLSFSWKLEGSGTLEAYYGKCDFVLEISKMIFLGPSDVKGNVATSQNGSGHQGQEEQLISSRLCRSSLRHRKPISEVDSCCPEHRKRPHPSRKYRNSVTTLRRWQQKLLADG